MSNFTQDFMARLDSRLNLSVEDMNVIFQELEKFINDYEITPRSTEVSTYDPIPQCFQSFMVAKKIEGLSMKTLKLYGSVLTKMFNVISKPVERITSNDIRVYLYKIQQDTGISNRTLDCNRSIIHSFFKWCATEKYIEDNPCEQIKAIKFESVPREPLSGVEMEEVRKYCKDIREKALIETLYSTGCRVSELIGLKKSDVDFDKKEVKLFGKGNKHRTSYINAKMEVALKDYLDSRADNSEYVFVSSREPHDALSKAGVERIVSKIGVRAGLNRPLFPHLIRHTTATDALNRGMNVPELQSILGHSKPETTMIYAKVSDSNAKHDHEKFVI